MDRMTDEQIKQELENLKFLDFTLSKIKKAGMCIPERPNDNQNLFKEWETLKRKHRSMSNIPFEELGEFLDRWTSLISYTRWVESVADLEQQSTKEVRDMVKKQLYVNKDGNREMKDALVHIDPIYKDIEKKYIEKLSLYTSIRGLREGYETRSNAISREISRRTQEIQDLRRGANRGGF
jgi:hypothetical protein